jgi:hypothetical protein
MPRAGLANSAAQGPASPSRAIMAQTRHKSLPMVRGYIRDGSLFRENAAAMVGPIDRDRRRRKKAPPQGQHPHRRAILAPTRRQDISLPCHRK